MKTLNWRQALILAFCCDAENNATMISDKEVGAGIGFERNDVGSEMQALATDGFLEYISGFSCRDALYFRVTADGRGYVHFIKQELDKTHLKQADNPLWKVIRTAYEEGKDFLSTVLAKAAVETLKSNGVIP